MKNLQGITVAVLAMFLIACATEPKTAQSASPGAEQNTASKTEAGTTQSAYSVDSTVGEILDDPKAKEVLVSYWPMADNPMLSQARGMTVRSLARFPQTGLNEEKLEEINQGLTTMTVNPDFVKRAEESRKGLSVDSTIGELMDNPEAKEILISYWPEANNPRISMARGMTLRAVASYPQSSLSKEKLEKIDQALAAIEAETNE